MNKTNERFKLFSVTSEKLILMSFSTGSFYCFYWLFKNWEGICNIRKKNHSPLIRTGLYPFYNFSLFKEIKSLAEEKDITVWWTSSLIAICYLIFLLGFYFPYMWIISVFAGLVFIPVNNVCEQINAANGFVENSQEGFHKIDWVITIIGGIYVIMAILKAILLSEFYRNFFH